MNKDLTLAEQLPYIVQLGLNIAIARKHYFNPPLTQQELANTLGRSQHYVSRVERGLIYPTLEELEVIAQLAEVELMILKPNYSRF